MKGELEKSSYNRLICIRIVWLQEKGLRKKAKPDLWNGILILIGKVYPSLSNYAGKEGDIL